MEPGVLEHTAVEVRVRDRGADEVCVLEITAGDGQVVGLESVGVNASENTLVQGDVGELVFRQARVRDVGVIGGQVGGGGVADETVVDIDLVER